VEGGQRTSPKPAEEDKAKRKPNPPILFRK
jgi:hypothetical protein